MKNRQFLMLAHDFQEGKHRVGGCFMSEKLDGMRAVWIPQARGMDPKDVPFLNVEKKKKGYKPVVTGLFSRYGNIIFAPDAFLDQLPKDVILDGELNFGRGGWKQTMMTVKDHVPGPGWDEVQYSVFDAPTPQQLFEDGRINETSFKKTISWTAAKLAFGFSDDSGDSLSKIYEFRYKWLSSWLLPSANVHLMVQELLPFNTVLANHRLAEFKDSVLSAGGEGIMLRFASSEWEPRRSHYMYRIKAELDSEATVTGYTTGEGKYNGMLGSLRVVWNNVTFDLSGFTDKERELHPEFQAWASGSPDSTDMDRDLAVQFPRGTVVQFKYREVTPDGKPKEARYYRSIS